MLATIAAAHAVGADLDDVVARIATIASPQRRMSEHRRTDGVVLIGDDYKAAGDMLEDSAAFLRDAKANRRVLVVGKLSDTRRLGKVLRALARRCREFGITLVTVGEASGRALKAPQIGWHDGVGVLESVIDVIDFIKASLKPGDLVLL